MRYTKLLVVVGLAVALAGAAGIVAATAPDAASQVSETQSNEPWYRMADDDGDGIRNWADVDVTPPILSADWDQDGTPNGEDSDFVMPLFFADADGDGIVNGADADFPLPLFGLGPGPGFRHRGGFGPHGECGPTPAPGATP